MLRDVAVSIAGGAQNLAGTAVLRDQQRLFGQVASVPTMWRSLNATNQGMARIALVRNRVRERVWELIEARRGAIPPLRTCYGDLGPVVVIRIDASLVQSHSDKQHAAGNFKGGYGFQCAMRRSVVSPTQLGRTEGRFLGPMAYPMSKG